MRQYFEVIIQIFIEQILEPERQCNSNNLNIYTFVTGIFMSQDVKNVGRVFLFVKLGVESTNCLMKISRITASLIDGFELLLIRGETKF